MCRAKAFLLLLVVTACVKAEERAEVVKKVHAENQELRRLVAALSAENAALRTSLLGREPWRGVVEVKRVGGPGGLVPYVRLCPRGEAVTGVDAAAGRFVDSIALVCGPISPRHLPKGTSEVGTVLERAGSPDVGGISQRCPDGTYVVGLKGRAGGLVDALELQCAAIKPEKGADGDSGAQGAAGGGTEAPKAPIAPALPRALPRIGGTGGEPFASECPDGFVVVGMSGRHGEHLNSISLLCVDPR